MINFLSFLIVFFLFPPPQDEEKCCKLCNRKYEAPRILSCLHVFCTSCIANLVEGGGHGPELDDEDDKMAAHFGADDKSLAPETEKLLNGLTRLRQNKKNAAADAVADALVIACPACQQVSWKERENCRKFKSVHNNHKNKLV